MIMDLTSKALSRVIWQYKNSPKFNEWISTIPIVAQQEIEEPAEAIINILDIDNIGGELLNIAGRIVGQDRDSDLLLDDDIYRIVIRSKIFKNNSIALLDDIKLAAEAITGSFVSQVTDNQNMSFGLTFSETISQQLADLIVTFDLIPRPQGVKLSGFVNPPEGLAFGFSEPGMATPSYIAGFSELFGDGVYALELDDTALLELDDGSEFGIGELDTPATIGGGAFVEFVGIT